MVQREKDEIGISIGIKLLFLQKTWGLDASIGHEPLVVPELENLVPVCVGRHQPPMRGRNAAFQNHIREHVHHSACDGRLLCKMTEETRKIKSRWGVNEKEFKLDTTGRSSSVCSAAGS